MFYQQVHDLFNRPEKPYVVLCNPNKSELYSLDNITDTTLRLRYNALSEFDFTIPEYDDGKKIEAYDYVVSKRYVLIEGIGYFLIENPQELMDGITRKKVVTAKSIECELNYKRLVGLSGTHKLYDPVTPNGTLLDKLVKMAPGWSVGVFDSALIGRARTFKVSESTIYGFLMGEVESAFECIFTFDTFQRKINVYSKNNVTKETDIYLSFDNLIRNVSLNTISEEIVTCMHVYGGGELDIRAVNPLGTNTIYNFDYYKSTNWLSEGLLTNINIWENKISDNQQDFSDYLTQLKNQNNLILDLNNNPTTGLAKLEKDYAVLESTQAARISAGLPYTDITNLMNTKQGEINAKKKQISDADKEYTRIDGILQGIVNSLKLESNFTIDQLKELGSYTIENTYKNNNFIKTDLMTYSEIQDMSHDLYDQAKEVLARVAVPRYEFEIDTVNFLWLKEFKPFADQIELGSKVTVDVDNYTIVAVLLEIEFDFNDPNKFKLTFSNRLRLDNGEFRYSDLFGEVVKTSSAVGFESDKWSDWTENYKGEVAEFISGSLDASKNNVINATNQEFIIGANGLRGRKSTGTGTYDKEQVWMTSNTIAFTKDNWATASSALGKLSNGLYGLVGEVIVGKIIAGENLTIESQKQDGSIALFKVDGTGVKIHNSILDITSTKGIINIDPTYGIRVMGKNTNDQWVRKFQADMNGNVTFSGNLEGATGTFSGSVTATTGKIGGWAINGNGLFQANASGQYDPGLNHIFPNDIRLGQLTIIGNNAVFSGKFKADQLEGQIMNDQIASGVDAGKVSVGSMSGDRVYGGSIRWDGVSLTTKGNGYSYLEADGIDIVARGMSKIQVANTIYLQSGETLVSGTLRVGGSLTVNGSFSIGYITLSSPSSLNVSSGTLYSGDVNVGGSYSAKRLEFSHGLLTNSYIL